MKSGKKDFIFLVWMFQGKPVGTPDPGTFFRVIQDHNVKGMFTAPTALRAIRAEVGQGQSDVSLFSCSENTLKQARG